MTMIPQETIAFVPGLDPGIYLAEIGRFEETYWPDGRLIWRGEYRIHEPVDRAGMPYNDTFWIGTNEDPQAQAEGAVANSPGARNFAALCEKVGVQYKGLDTAQVFQNLLGQKVMIEITMQTYTSKKAETFGQIKTGAGVKGYHSVGERVAAVAPKMEESAPAPYTAPAGIPFGGAGQATPLKTAPTAAPAPAPRQQFQAPGQQVAPVPIQPQVPPNGPVGAAIPPRVPPAR